MSTPFPAVTPELMAELKLGPSSNLLPTSDQLKTISDLIVAAKVPAASTTKVALGLDYRSDLGKSDTFHRGGAWNRCV